MRLRNLFKHALSKTFTFKNKTVKWDGFHYDSNKGTYTSWSVEYLNGHGNSPVEALINLAEKFEQVADLARLAAESAKITYDKMHIEPIPKLTAGEATTKDGLKHNQFMIESNDGGKVVVK